MLRSALLFVVATSFLLVLAGCSTLHVGLLDPRPNVNLPKSQSTLSLRLGSRVEDVYTVPRENGVGPTEVNQWRASLAAAFKNAFGDSFSLAPSDGDLVLEVQEAEIAMVPAAVTSGAAVVSGRAQIRYKAQLLDKSGKQLALTAGTVESKTTASSMSGASSIAKSAMESMFEDIVAQLFTQGAKGGGQTSGQMMDTR
jgi:hypothetical protein